MEFIFVFFLLEVDLNFSLCPFYGTMGFNTVLNTVNMLNIVQTITYL